jgi:hypothetical protein
MRKKPEKSSGYVAAFSASIFNKPEPDFEILGLTIQREIPAFPRMLLHKVLQQGFAHTFRRLSAVTR